MAAKGCTHLNRYIANPSLLFNLNKKQDRLFSYSSYCIPKPIHIKNKNYAKISNDFGFGGDDSYFTLKKNVNNDEYESLFVGISDGISSCKDSSNYAQQLMLSANKYLSNNEYFSDNNLLYEIAEYSSKYVNEENKYDGAATLCLININNYNLNGLNLGDSAFCVYRQKHIDNNDDDISYYLEYSSPSQFHTFGVPYHLGSNSNSSNIKDAYYLNNFQLKSKDILIIATDGLWDNLYQNDIELILSQYFTKYINDNDDNNNIHNNLVKYNLTHKILRNAYFNSIDKEISTPWSQTMTQTFDMIYNGGKQDDITCVIVFVH